MSAAEAQQLRAVVESLMATSMAETAHVAHLEKELDAAATKLGAMTASEQHRLAEVASLEAQLADQRRQHEEAAATAAANASDAARLRGELAAASAAKVALLSSSDALVNGVCALLLSAHEAGGSIPKLEPPANRVGAGRTAAEQQAALQRANFEAAYGAYQTSCQQTEGLVSLVTGLAAPLADFRGAVRAALHGPNGNGGSGAASGASGAASGGNGAASGGGRGGDGGGGGGDGGGGGGIRALTGGDGEDRSARRSEQRHLQRSTSETPTSMGADLLASPADEASAGRLATPGTSEPDGGGAVRTKLVSTKFDVVIPDGASPGDELRVALPSGDEVTVTIPDDAPPGSVLTCSALTSTSASPV